MLSEGEFLARYPGLAMVAYPDPALARYPDAALLAACARFDRQHHAVMEFPAAETDLLQAEFDRLLEQRWLVSDAIKEMQPATLAGAIAKARVAIVLLAENRGEDPDEADTSFAMAALIDMTWLEEVPS